MSIAELEARILVLEAIILNAIEIPDYAKSVNDSTVAIGDFVYGIKAGINSGAFFQGYVQGTAPPTSDSHIDFTYQL